MTLKPLADHIVIQFKEEETTTSSGIILATANKEKSMIAQVIAVGPGKEEEPMMIQVGNKVLTSKYSGTEVKLDGETYSIIRQSDILALVE